MGAQGSAHALHRLSREEEPARRRAWRRTVDAEIARRRRALRGRRPPPDPLDDVRPRLRRAAARPRGRSAQSWPARLRTRARRRPAPTREPPLAADARTAQRPALMAKLNMVKALNLALLQEMERDADVLIIGEDVGVDGGVFRVTEDLHRKFGAQARDRQPARRGRHHRHRGRHGALRAQARSARSSSPASPSSASTRSRTTPRAIAMRSQGRFHVPDGDPHAVRRRRARARAPLGESRSSSTRTSPGSRWSMPSGPAQRARAAGGRHPRSRSRRLLRGQGALPRGQGGRARRVGDDADRAAPSVDARGRRPHAGRLRRHAARRRGRPPRPARAEDGVQAEIIDLLTISPLDRETLVASVAKTGRAVIVHEAPRSFGPGAEIAASHHGGRLPLAGGADPARHRLRRAVPRLRAREGATSRTPRAWWPPRARRSRSERRCPARSSLPDLGEGLTEAEIVKVLVREGDVIQEDAPAARGRDRQGAGRDPVAR